MTKQKWSVRPSEFFLSRNTTNLIRREGAENCSDPIEFKIEKVLKIILTKNTVNQINSFMKLTRSVFYKTYEKYI